jgi:hypothetical protein
MTAQIINLSDYRKPAQTASTMRRRGLRLTDDAAGVLARLNRGEVVTDLGQIDKATRRALDKLTRRDMVLKGCDYTFPKAKTCWIGRASTREDLTDKLVTFVPSEIAEIRSGDRSRFAPLVDRA